MPPRWRAGGARPARMRAATAELERLAPASWRVTGSRCCTAGCARARSSRRWARSPPAARRARRHDRDRGRHRRAERDGDAGRERRAFRDLAAAPAARAGRARRAPLALPAGRPAGRRLGRGCARCSSTPTAFASRRSTSSCASEGELTAPASPASASSGSRGCPRMRSCSSRRGPRGDDCRRRSASCGARARAARRRSSTRRSARTRWSRSPPTRARRAPLRC